MASLDAGSRKSVAMGSLKLSGKIKRVLSAPKSLSTRRKSLSGIFKSRPKNPSENGGEFDSLSSSFNSLNFVDKYQRKRSTSRIRSISANDNYPVINHPHDYGGITKITRSSQTCSDLDLPSSYPDTSKKKTQDAVTQTQELTRKVFGGRPRILTNPRCHPWHPCLQTNTSSFSHHFPHFLFSYQLNYIFSYFRSKCSLVPFVPNLLLYNFPQSTRIFFIIPTYLHKMIKFKRNCLILIYPFSLFPSFFLISMSVVKNNELGYKFEKKELRKSCLM